MDRAYQNLFSGSCIFSPTCTLNQLCLRILNAIIWWYGMIWSHLTSDSLVFKEVGGYMTRCSEYKSWINSHSLSYLGRYRAALAAKKDQSRNRQPQQPLLGEARTLWGDQRVGGPKKRSQLLKFTWFWQFLLSAVEGGGPKPIFRTGTKGISHSFQSNANRYKTPVKIISAKWRNSSGDSKLTKSMHLSLAIVSDNAKTK